jgi:hypothetical protein
MTEIQKQVREYLARIGARGGRMSRRDLTKSHARQMVAIREAKRAAFRASVGRAANITAGRGHAWEGEAGHGDRGSREALATAQPQVGRTLLKSLFHHLS